MQITKSINGVPVRLTDERWAHITRGHPEMLNQAEEVLRTLNEPDKIQLGDTRELLALRRYDKTPVTTNKILVVAYRETSPEDGFIITAYFTSRPSTTRETLWIRSKP
ncbi:MAG: hypothetical protein AAF810_11300 [Cyanobacteria bacterium P01_D01_bin.36]